MAVNFGVFGEGADCGKVVFLELVRQQAEPPAEQYHVSGGEGQATFFGGSFLSSTASGFGSSM